MNGKHVLTSVPPGDWSTDQVVVFDWSDGPRQGIARMATPRCEFAFTLVDERHNPVDLDDRLLRISELPEGSVAKVLDLIRSLGSPANVVWVPAWKFATDADRSQADRAIDAILGQSKDTGLIIQTRDMITFLGCWDAVPQEGNGQDLFSALGII